MSTRARLVAIRSEGAATYVARLRDELGTEREFTFIVEGAEIEVVRWGDDFYEYMDLNVSPAAALYEAILAFHRARTILR